MQHTSHMQSGRNCHNPKGSKPKAKKKSSRDRIASNKRACTVRSLKKHCLLETLLSKGVSLQNRATKEIYGRNSRHMPCLKRKKKLPLRKKQLLMTKWRSCAMSRLPWTCRNYRVKLIPGEEKKAVGTARTFLNLAIHVLLSPQRA